jgi:hypothetical protein
MSASALTIVISTWAHNIKIISTGLKCPWIPHVIPLKMKNQVCLHARVLRQLCRPAPSKFSPDAEIGVAGVWLFRPRITGDAA